MELIKNISSATGITVGATFVLLNIANLSLPVVMSYTGVIVPGIGTFHGAVTATVASFAVSRSLIPAVASGVVVGTLMHISV